VPIGLLHLNASRLFIQTSTTQTAVTISTLGQKPLDKKRQPLKPPAQQQQKENKTAKFSLTVGYILDLHAYLQEIYKKAAMKQTCGRRTVRSLYVIARPSVRPSVCLSSVSVVCVFRL